MLDAFRAAIAEQNTCARALAASADLPTAASIQATHLRHSTEALLRLQVELTRAMSDTQRAFVQSFDGYAQALGTADKPAGEVASAPGTSLETWMALWNGNIKALTETVNQSFANLQAAAVAESPKPASKPVPQRGRRRTVA
jgi:hypothetical protein